MKKLGIIVPVYNVENYLKQCVTSILNQSYTNIEVILIDDGSTDSSGNICDQFASEDSRVKVIHQKNKGMIAARLAGINKTMCEYVTFVDSDDWISSNVYQEVAAYMLQDVDIISYRIIRYYSADNMRINTNFYKEGIYNKEDVKEKLFPTMIWNVEKNVFGIDPSIWSKIFKKDLLLDSLMAAKDLNISYGEDAAVVFPTILKADTIAITNIGYYYHRQRMAGEVAGYLQDEEFNHKLLILYDYLVNQFEHKELFVRQIDYYFAESALRRLTKYGGVVEQKEHLFPFDKIPPNSTIILYGAGGCGREYFEQIERLKYANMAGWFDKNYSLYASIGVKSVQEIEKITKFDYIVIAIEKKDTAQKVKQMLMTTYNVPKEKIVWSIV